MTANKQHWEKVYETKGDHEVSWYEDVPTSIQIIDKLNLDKNAKIIDIGGGNSNFTAELLKKGYLVPKEYGISILDISAKAIERTKEKLGELAKSVDFIVSDVTEFQPEVKYDVWHDRATFHFLTDEVSIQKYVQLVSEAVKPKGYFILATFSKSGPLKCSGLEITQYSKEKIEGLFSENFEIIESKDVVHTTPFNTAQNFIYTVLSRK